MKIIFHLSRNKVSFRRFKLIKCREKVWDLYGDIDCSLPSIPQFQVYAMTHDNLVNVVYSVGVCPLSNPPGPIKDCYEVMLDGKIVGYVAEDQAESLAQKLRVMKVKGLQKVHFKSLAHQSWIS